MEAGGGRGFGPSGPRGRSRDAPRGEPGGTCRVAAPRPLVVAQPGRAMTSPAGVSPARRFGTWLLRSPEAHEGQYQAAPGASAPDEKRRPWWQVMCLTGVDYFSTLGYQP